MKFRIAIIALVAGILLVMHGQQQTTQDAGKTVSLPGTIGTTSPVKFPISALEQAKLETLKAKREAINATIRAVKAEMQISLDAFMQEVNAYVATTLKAHGDPKGVGLKSDTMEWEVKPDTTPVPETKKKNGSK